MCATLVASTDEIPDVGSHLLTVREPDGSLEEVILLDLEDGVSASNIEPCFGQTIRPSRVAAPSPRSNRWSVSCWQ